MSNKEAFDIVLKLAKANTLAEHDIMYAQQEESAEDSQLIKYLLGLALAQKRSNIAQRNPFRRLKRY